MALCASCHCGAVKLEVEQMIQNTTVPRRISLCHCNNCRHATGLLCTSYLPIFKPKISQVLNLSTFRVGKTQRHFCWTCGCHIFQSRSSSVPEGFEGGSNREEWQVATGVLNHAINHVRIGSHVHVSETLDGGLSVWVDEQLPEPLRAFSRPASMSRQVSAEVSKTQEKNTVKKGSKENPDLQAFCACGTVCFHVSRPDASSKLPKSPFPDLMIPYHTQDPLIPNPDNKTWWLWADNTKYLAGTCACRSCRLTSGFEIQTWAFIPRSNIYFHIKENESIDTPLEIPLEFEKLPSGILRSYESSPGVMREFCGKCGATVFWHDKWRPELVDVSVGLFNAEAGARAENWLEWWTERISFEEDAAVDRMLKDDDSRFDLIPSLKRGLVAWRKNHKAY